MGPERHKTQLIAELGCNHCGSEDIALSMVRMCSVAGVDDVKLQLRDVSTCRPGWDRPYVGPQSYGDTYWEHRKALELSEAAYGSVVAHAHSIGLRVGASPWDVPSVGLAQWLGVDWLKVASAMVTDMPVLRAVAATGLPVVLSAGMSEHVEIDAALEALGGADAILVCTACYPCRPADVHLRRMDTLRARYPGVRVGVSGHWPGIQIDAAAVALGAEVIERHVTLDRTMKGTDHAASLESGGVVKWVRDIRTVEAALGGSDLGVLECERSARAKLRG